MNAAKWLLSCMIEPVCLQVTRSIKNFVTLSAAKRLLTCMKEFMCLQVTRCIESFVTLSAAKWLLSFISRSEQAPGSK